MRLRWLFIVAFLLFPLEGMLAQSTAAPHLKNRSRLEVVWGRLCFLGPEGRSAGINLKSLGSSRVKLQLSQDSEGLANISYKFQNASEFGWLEVTSGFTISEVWIDRRKETYVLFVQPGGSGPIHLEVGLVSDAMKELLRDAFEKNHDLKRFHGQDPTVWEANSFWELLFLAPVGAQNAMQEVLIKNSGDGKITANLRNCFMEALLQTKNPQNSEPPFSQDQLRELLQKMASDDFAERREADQKLREVGSSLLFLLNEIRWETCPPEVQLRLKRILQSMGEEFHSEKPSFLLDLQFWARDPRMWAAVLEFGTPEQREDAWAVLCEKFLVPSDVESLAYDPKIDSEKQAEKIRKIRNLAGRK